MLRQMLGSGSYMGQRVCLKVQTQQWEPFTEVEVCFQPHPHACDPTRSFRTGAQGCLPCPLGSVSWS